MAGPGPGGTFNSLNNSAAEVIKNGAGAVFTVVVTAVGDGPGALYDNNSTASGNVVAALLGYVPAQIGVYPFYGFPFSTGLVFEPGVNQVASIAYS